MQDDARTQHHNADHAATQGRPPESIPPDLLPTASALDRLADTDRAEPGEGFENRIAHATRPGVTGTIGVTGRHPAWRWALPMAACLSVLVGGLWALRPGNPAVRPGSPAIGLAAVSVEAEIDDLLFIDDLSGSLLDSTDFSTGSTGLDDESAGDLFLDAFGGGVDDEGGST